MLHIHWCLMRIKETSIRSHKPSLVELFHTARASKDQSCLVAHNHLRSSSHLWAGTHNAPAYTSNTLFVSTRHINPHINPWTLWERRDVSVVMAGDATFVVQQGGSATSCWLRPSAYPRLECHWRWGHHSYGCAPPVTMTTQDTSKTQVRHKL